jgi:hypothetical protein
LRNWKEQFWTEKRIFLLLFSDKTNRRRVWR